MKRTPRKRTRSSTVLTNPDPKFVSLVRAGANLTPFMAVKAIKEAVEVAEEDMNLDTITKAADTDISKIIFPSDKFEDEQSVQTWLSEGNYDDYEIESEGDSFIVKGAEDLTDVTEIAAGDVRVFVGKRPVEAEKEEEDNSAEAESAAAVVAKEDEADETPAEKTTGVIAEQNQLKSINTGDESSKKETLDEDEGDAAEAEAEATKDESVADPLTALKEFIAEKEEELKAKGLWEVNDLSMVFKTLFWMVEDSDWNGLSESAKDEIVKAAEGILKALGTVMQDTFEEFIGNFEDMASKEVESEKEAEEAEAEVEETSEKDDGSEDTSEEVDDITSLKAQVSELTELVKNLSKSDEDEESGVKSVNETRQTLKGADLDESKKEQSGAKKRTSDSEDIAERRARSTLGISISSRY